MNELLIGKNIEDIEFALSSDDGTNSGSTVAQSLYREAEMIARGVGGAVVDTIKNPADKLIELGFSAAVGTALGAASRLGAPGKAISIGVGAALTAKMGYDELTGNRWSTFGAAVKDSWRSGANMEQNVAATRDSLGSFLVDSGVGYASMKVSSLALSRFAPPSKLVNYTLRAADKDNGAGLLRLQNRWEDPNKFRKFVDSEHEVVSYSQSAVPGAARGDLVRVARTPEGNILLAAMDVEGHRIGAAKKSVQAQAAIDNALPQTHNKTASDVLSLIDKQLRGDDDLSITAGVMIYDPRTHKLQTATASSELAYVVRANGHVRQLDAVVGGVPIGTEMPVKRSKQTYRYWSDPSPKGNEVIYLGKGDTVIMASDGVSDRTGYSNAGAFKAFLKKIGPNPAKLKDAILGAPDPETGVDDSSFLIFHRNKSAKMPSPVVHSSNILSFSH